MAEEAAPQAAVAEKAAEELSEETEPGSNPDQGRTCSVWVNVCIFGSRQCEALGMRVRFWALSVGARCTRIALCAPRDDSLSSQDLHSLRPSTPLASCFFCEHL